MSKRTRRRPPHYYEPGWIYFITTNTENWKSFFADERNTLLLIEDFKFYRRKFDFKIYLYVIMPDNPVRAGLVQEPQDYKFSSFRNLYLGDDSVIKLDVAEW